MLKIALTVCLASFTAAAEPRDVSTQVCVVGGGSGGMSAALAAARAGAEVVLIERLDRLGGTSTLAYVCGWEPGPGDSFAREFYGRLRRLGAAGLSSETNAQRKLGPFALWRIVSDLPYEESLYRAGTPYYECHGVLFDPEKLSTLVADLLQATGRCRVMFNTRFVSVEMAGPRVMALLAEAADGTVYRIRARVFIDATGDVDLCRAAGCETMLGEDPWSRFQEPSAPEKPQLALNGISLCYRLRKADRPTPPRDPGAVVPKLRRTAHVTELPCGDLIVNPLAIMPGTALVEQGRDKVYEACRPLVEAHWHWLHQYASFAPYEFHSFAPMLGVRECYRVVGDYVLTEHDLRAGRAQQHPDIVALADHAMDVHSYARGSKRTELPGPYGIPYRCLLPRGKENLLVACRGASFSHLALSSCRLSRTIIALGHAAGLAAAQAVQTGTSLRHVDMGAIQRAVRPEGKQP